MSTGTGVPFPTFAPPGAGRAPAKTPTQVRVVQDGHARVRSDLVATEEPLEIRLVAGVARRTVAVTMRTPGSDFELAAGFLFAEGVVNSREEIERISYCVDPDLDARQQYNIVNVALRAPELPELAALERHFYVNSACGVCGRAVVEGLRLRGCTPAGPGPVLDETVLRRLPERLRASQRLFDATGGLHAAGLFDARGELLCLREDVGRHNAMDKVVGWALLQGRLPLSDGVAVVSGRASFELVQKSVAAGIPVLCSVSAPTSLAVELARAFGVTLVGFLRGERFNVYSGFERIRPAGAGC